MKIKKIIAVIMLSMWYIAGVQAGEYAEDHALSGTETGHNDYEAENTIQSTQVIESGRTTYTAGKEIRLLPGFHAKEGSDFHAAIDDPSNRLTIMTYNLEKQSYGRHGDVIKACSPDIVSIQEIQKIEDVLDIVTNYSMEKLTSGAGLKGKFYAAWEFFGPHIGVLATFEQGVALLWNEKKLGKPSISTRRLLHSPLYKDDDDPGRSYIVAEWDDFVVIATHLSTDVDWNQAMVEAILFEISIKNYRKPIIIAGDLNPDSKGNYETKKYLQADGFEILNDIRNKELAGPDYPNDPYTVEHYNRHATSGNNPPGNQVDLILWKNYNPIRKIIWRGVPECYWNKDESKEYEGGQYLDWRLKISDHLPYIVKVKLK